MCGICGFTGEITNKDNVLRDMAQLIAHRGPDSSASFIDDKISMGICHLNLKDKKSAADQPICNEDESLVITFNGAIYNYKQLQQQLEELGHTFTTNTDTEVLIHAFEQWGKDMLTRLRGMFAFVIWNKNDKSLFMARDHFGIKPIHYAFLGEHFIYGSEIKSILAFPGFEKKLNMNTLNNYLSFQYAVPPETFFEGVYCLLPAHYLIYKDGEIQIERYFEPEFEIDSSITESQAVEEIEKVFEETINTYKTADVEVGCFLSSGVDSSYVSTFFSGQKAFTVGFDFGEKYNEIDFSKRLAEKMDLEHHYKVISSDEFWGNIKKVQYHMDQPLADPSCIALFFVSKLASEHVKIVLSGEGADEFFGGYTVYNQPRVFKYYHMLPQFIRTLLRKLVQAIPGSFKGKGYIIRAELPINESFIGNANMFKYEEKLEIMKNPEFATRPQEITKKFYDKVSDLDEVTRMQYLDINLWMVGDILLKADRMSSANSIELRVPFLDREVFKVASRLPTKLKVNNKNTKYAMRQAANRRLPLETAQKEKLGFPVPTRVWLRDEKYYNIVKNAFNSSIAKKFFNTDKIQKYLDIHYSEKHDFSRMIWTVFVFIVWYQIYFEDGDHEAGSPLDFS